MINNIKTLFASIALIAMMSSTVHAQSIRCNADGNDLNNVLDSRINQSSEYCQSITLGIAFLLNSECDSALTYLQSANTISTSESLTNLIAQVEGDIKANPAKAEVPVQSTTTTTPARSDEKTAGASEESTAAVAQESGSEETTITAVAPAKAETEKAFNEQQLDEFKAKGLQKVKRLTDYLNILVQKTTNSSNAMSTVNNAMNLFDGEDHTVEVSSLSRPDKSRFPVRTYLNRLRMLSYSRVEITGAAFTYVSSFRKGPDGNYYGVARFRQTFTGYVDNRPTYSDVTTKTVAVVLKPYQKAEEGTSVQNWDVFLGDIAVAQTEKN